MPIRNEAAMIARSLGAVMAQDYPADRFEVLIVDGASDDSTLATVATVATVESIVAARGINRPAVRTLHNPARNQAAGLNIGLHAARGTVIVRVDGHTLVPPGYVRHCVRGLATTGAQNFGGAQVFTADATDSLTTRAIAAACRSPFAVPSAFRAAPGDAAPRPADTVYMGAWPRAVFDAVGFFDVTMPPQEDYALNLLIRRHGGTIWFDPALRSAYYGRQTFGALAAQYFRYGMAKARLLARYPRSARARQLVAPIFVAAQALWLVAPLWPLIAAVDGLYAALALAFAARATRAERALLPGALFAFAVIHTAWGAGFWVGCVRGVWRVLRAGPDRHARRSVR